MRKSDHQEAAPSTNAPTSASHRGRLARRSNLLVDFLAVVREGGVRAAAEKVHVTQSALTRRIQELEQSLEVDLFERTVHGMKLTTFGEALMHHAELVEMNCNYASAEIAQLLSGAAGVLRIAAGPAWTYQLAPDAIASTKAQLPAIQVSLLERMNETTLPMLEAGQLDVVLGGLPETKDRLTDLRYEPLIEIEHKVFSSNEHPLQRKRQVTPKDLSLVPWVWFAEVGTGRRHIENLFAHDNLPTPVTSVDTASALSGFRVMKDNHHVMLLPSTLEHVAAIHGLKPIRLRHSVGSYVAGMIYRPSVLRLHAFTLFRQALIDSIADAYPKSIG